MLESAQAVTALATDEAIPKRRSLRVVSVIHAFEGVGTW